MKTGDIHDEQQLKELFDDNKDRTHTPLSDEEHATIAPLNRKDRRAALVKMRQEARKAKVAAP